VADEGGSVSEIEENTIRFTPYGAALHISSPSGQRSLQLDARLEDRRRFESSAGESLGEDKWIVYIRENELVPYAKEHGALGLFHGKPEESEHLVAFAIPSRQFETLLDVVRAARLPKQVSITVKSLHIKFNYEREVLVWATGDHSDRPLITEAQFYAPLIEPEDPFAIDGERIADRPNPESLPATTGAIQQLERNVRKEITEWRSEIRSAMIWVLIGLAIYYFFKH
jgi:hypothetical protein